MKVIDNNGKEVSRLTIIAKYFRKDNESLEDFNRQLKVLSDADKTELAVGAAKELGFTVVAE